MIILLFQPCSGFEARKPYSYHTLRPSREEKCARELESPFSAGREKRQQAHPSAETKQIEYELRLIMYESQPQHPNTLFYLSFYGSNVKSRIPEEDVGGSV